MAAVQSLQIQSHSQIPTVDFSSDSNDPSPFKPPTRTDSPDQLDTIPSNENSSTTNVNSLHPSNTNEARRSASPRPGLSPVTTPLAILPSYIRQSSLETSLHLTRKINSQYTIKTADSKNDSIFHIDIHGIFRPTCTVYDAKLHIALLEIRERSHNHGHGHAKGLQTSVKRHSTDSKAMYVGAEPESDGVFLGEFDNVAYGAGGKLLGGHGRSLYVRNETGEKWGLVGTSVIRDRGDDCIAATIQRSDELSEPEYTVTIAPGVDMSLIVAFCISMDHKWEKEKR